MRPKGRNLELWIQAPWFGLIFRTAQQIGVVAELSSPQDSPSEFCMLTSRYDEARTSPLPDEELEII